MIGSWCLTPISTMYISVLLVEEAGVPRENKSKVNSLLFVNNTLDLDQIKCCLLQLQCG